MVAELLFTDLDVTDRYNPALVWIDVSNITGIRPGWQEDAKGFSPPPAAPVPTAPTLAQLQTKLESISAQISTLAIPSGQS
jgi:hypothetical protein